MSFTERKEYIMKYVSMRGLISSMQAIETIQTLTMSCTNHLIKVMSLIENKSISRDMKMDLLTAVSVMRSQSHRK